MAKNFKRYILILRKPNLEEKIAMSLREVKLESHSLQNNVTYQ